MPERHVMGKVSCQYYAEMNIIPCVAKSTYAAIGGGGTAVGAVGGGPQLLSGHGVTQPSATELLDVRRLRDCETLFCRLADFKKISISRGVFCPERSNQRRIMSAVESCVVTRRIYYGRQL